MAKEAASAAPGGAAAEAIIEALLTASIQEGNPNAAWLVAQTAEHEAQRLSATISEDLVEGARRALAAESDEELRGIRPVDLRAARSAGRRSG